MGPARAALLASILAAATAACPWDPPREISPEDSNSDGVHADAGSASDRPPIGDSATNDTAASDSATSDSATSDSATSDTAASDSATSDSATSDSATNDSGAAADRQGMELVDPSLLIGEIRVEEPEVGDRYTMYIQAEIYDRPYRFEEWYTHDEEGPCRYRGSSVHPDTFYTFYCEPACEAGLRCSPAGECVPYLQQVNAGPIRVHGLTVEASLELEVWGYSRVDHEQTDDLFDPGERVWAEAEGGQLPAFAVEARGVDRLSWPLGERLDIVDGLPLEISWDPGGVPEARVEIVINQNTHGIPIGEIRCEVADTGHLTVPARLLELLPYTQDWHVGLMAAYITRFTEGVVFLDQGPVRLRVQSRAPRGSSHNRPLLTMMTGGVGQCEATAPLAHLAETPWRAMALCGQADRILLARSRPDAPGDLLEVGTFDRLGRLGPPTQITTAGGSGISELDLRVVNGAGWLVWAAAGGGGEAIFFARIDDAGELAVGPLEVAGSRAPLARAPQLVVEGSSVNLMWVGGADTPNELYLAPLHSDGALVGEPRRVYTGEGAVRSPQPMVEQYWDGAAWLEERGGETAAYYGEIDNGVMTGVSRLTLPHHQSDAIDYVRGLGVDNYAMGLLAWTEVRHDDDPSEAYSFIRLMEHGVALPLTTPVPGEADSWPRAAAGPLDDEFGLVWIHGVIDGQEAPRLTETTLRSIRFRPDINASGYTLWPRSEVVELLPPAGGEVSRPQVTRTPQGFLFSAELEGEAGEGGPVPGWGAVRCN